MNRTRKQEYRKEWDKRNREKTREYSRRCYQRKKAERSAKHREETKKRQDAKLAHAKKCFAENIELIIRLRFYIEDKAAERRRAKARARYQKNADKENQRDRERYHRDIGKSRAKNISNYKKHREKRIDYANGYRKEHPDYHKDWYKKNPDKNALYHSNRRAAKLDATPVWKESEGRLIRQLYKKRTELSKLWGIELQVDHIIPLQGKGVSGLDTWHNLQLIPATDNASKNNRYQQDW